MELLINANNHAKYDAVTDRYDRLWNEALAANFSVNNYLDSKLGDRTDWGGRYDTWLKGLGIDPETENGWWSLAAIDPDNLRLFIDTYQADWDTEDGALLLEAESSAIKTLAKLSFCGSFRSHYNRASTVLILLSD